MINRRTFLGAAAATASTTLIRPGSASAAGLTTFTIGTHNVQYGATKYGRLADVFGLQEVTDRTNANLARSLPDYTIKRGAGAANAVPILIRKSRFSVLKERHIQTHPGEKGVTPARFVHWVLLQDKATSAQFVFFNTHFISGAWNSHPSMKNRERWRLHAKILREEVARLRGTTDRPIIVVGDVNRPTALDLQGLSWLPTKNVAGTPIDQMFASTSVSRSKAVRRDKEGSDHFAYRATVSFTR